MKDFFFYKEKDEFSKASTWSQKLSTAHVRAQNDKLVFHQKLNLAQNNMIPSMSI